MEDTEFKTGDYIVATSLHNGTNCAKVGWVFKQRIDASYMRPEMDLIGNTDNGHSILMFEGGKWTWRYGTVTEGLEYERIGEPFETNEKLADPVLTVLEGLDKLEHKFNQ